MLSLAASLRAPARRTAFSSARIATASLRTSYRKFSTDTPPPPPAAKSNTAIYAGIGALAVGGVAYYFFSSNDTLGTTAASGVQVAKAATRLTPTKEDYQKVYDKVVEVLNSDASGEYDDGSYGPVLLRLGWHSSGTYDKVSGTGGSNYATMRFAPESLHGANNGLHVARAIMEEIHKEFPWISYGDLWTLGAVAAVQEAAGPKIPWRPGRIDGVADNVTPDGRLPDASQSQGHLRDIFYRMGFDDREIVALSGGHALGRAHPDRSGYDGPWTFSPTTMTNDFFKLLLDEKWVWKKWSGPKQLSDKKTGTLMMLPTDYALVADKSFKKWVQAYAADEQLFFKDFSAVVAKLFELGVPEAQFATAEPWYFKTGDEQKA